MFARSLARFSSYLIWIFGGILLRAEKSPRVRQRLGQLHDLLREAWHESYLSRTRSKYCLDPTVQFADGTFFYGAGRIRVDEATYFGRDCYVCAQPAEATIEIGRGCAISHSVHIRTASYRPDGDFAAALASEVEWADIKIGNHVWIGAHVFIGGGVTIGDNSVIGANSVVTDDVPPGCIYGGVPARLIRTKKGQESRGE